MWRGPGDRSSVLRDCIGWVPTKSGCDNRNTPSDRAVRGYPDEPDSQGRQTRQGTGCPHAEPWQRRRHGVFAPPLCFLSLCVAVSCAFVRRFCFLVCLRLNVHCVYFWHGGSMISAERGGKGASEEQTNCCDRCLTSLSQPHIGIPPGGRMWRPGRVPIWCRRTSQPCCTLWRFHGTGT